MKDEITEKTTNDYYKNVILPLINCIPQANSQQDMLMRCSPASISCMVNTAECFPPPVIQNVFSDKYCGISGDWFHSIIHDDGISDPYYVDLLYRGGLDKRKQTPQPVMKADVYVFNPNNKEVISACSHLDCNWRYVLSADYDKERNLLGPGIPLYANAGLWSQLQSSLLCPILKGVRLI